MGRGSVISKFTTLYLLRFPSNHKTKPKRMHLQDFVLLLAWVTCVWWLDKSFRGWSKLNSGGVS